MILDVYRVTLASGEQFLMAGNFARIESPIHVSHDDGDSWHSLPYQVANASHRTTLAAELCARYQAQPDDCLDVEQVAFTNRTVES